MKFAVEQADLLFLPKDEGYRYALVVVDVATRAMDAEPLKEKKTEAVLQAFRKIYARKYLKWPTKFLQVDSGSEFKSVVANFSGVQEEGHRRQGWQGRSSQTTDDRRTHQLHRQGHCHETSVRGTGNQGESRGVGGGPTQDRGHHQQGHDQAREVLVVAEARPFEVRGAVPACEKPSLCFGPGNFADGCICDTEKTR